MKKQQKDLKILADPATLKELIGAREAEAALNEQMDDDASTQAAAEDDVPPQLVDVSTNDDATLRDRLAALKLQLYPVDPIRGNGDCFAASIAESLSGEPQLTAAQVREKIIKHLRFYPDQPTVSCATLLRRYSSATAMLTPVYACFCLFLSVCE